MPAGYLRMHAQMQVLILSAAATGVHDHTQGQHPLTFSNAQLLNELCPCT